VMRNPIKSIRSIVESFGYDLSDLTDEEIEKGIARFGKAVSKCGMTTKELESLFSGSKKRVL